MSLNLKIVPGLNVPMVLFSSNEAPLLELLREQHAEIVEQLKRYGAILFRGFACQDTDYFSKAVEACGLGNRCDAKEYDLPRTYLPNDIYTSTDIPGDISLPMHHEKPRSNNPPNHIYFCCAALATQGGETFFANAKDIWLDMPKNIQDKILEHGVVYKQFFHAKTIKYFLLKKLVPNISLRSWSQQYGTDDKKQIENILDRDKLHWQWVNKEKDLILLNKLPGAVKHPLTKETVWMNSANYLNYYDNVRYGELNSLGFYEYFTTRYLIAKDMLPMVCHYGDGTAFSSKDAAEIKRIFKHHTCSLTWEKGDFMIVDNLIFVHGKPPHQGDRLLYSCMTAIT